MPGLVQDNVSVVVYPAGSMLTLGEIRGADATNPQVVHVAHFVSLGATIAPTYGAYRVRIRTPDGDIRLHIAMIP